MQLTMSVAGREQTMLVSGDRIWRDGRPGEPAPFESVPLVWERAFGGCHRIGEKVIAEERNPVGCGVSAGRPASSLEGETVPNLEHPATPLQQIGATPEPICFAPIAPAWLPRRAYAGTYDDQWQRSRAPYLPDDFDPRFFQCAAGDFAFDTYLQGGEPVRIDGARPDGPIEFELPDARLIVAVTIAGASTEPPVNLETLSIEPDLNRVCFTWRAAAPCDRQALKVEKIVVSRSGAGPRP
jgi:hypothetical protein